MKMVVNDKDIWIDSIRDEISLMNRDRLKDVILKQKEIVARKLQESKGIIGAKISRIRINSPITDRLRLPQVKPKKKSIAVDDAELSRALSTAGSSRRSPLPSVKSKRVVKQVHTSVNIRKSDRSISEGKDSKIKKKPPVPRFDRYPKLLRVEPLTLILDYCYWQPLSPNPLPLLSVAMMDSIHIPAVHQHSTVGGSTFDPHRSIRRKADDDAQIESTANREDHQQPVDRDRRTEERRLTPARQLLEDRDDGGFPDPQMEGRRTPGDEGDIEEEDMAIIDIDTFDKNMQAITMRDMRSTASSKGDIIRSKEYYHIVPQPSIGVDQPTIEQTGGNYYMTKVEIYY